MRCQCQEISNSGEGNNCLGFALEAMLLCTPQELRDALVHFMNKMRIGNRECRILGRLLAISLLDIDDDIRDEQLDRAIRCLKKGCFIPADVFLAYCEYMRYRHRKLLHRGNIVFFIKNKNQYIPQCSYYDNVALPTQYIGCVDNLHYQRLKLSPLDSRNFDLVYFGFTTRLLRYCV